MPRPSRRADSIRGEAEKSPHLPRASLLARFPPAKSSQAKRPVDWRSIYERKDPLTPRHGQPRLASPFGRPVWSERRYFGVRRDADTSRFALPFGRSIVRTVVVKKLVQRLS